MSNNNDENADKIAGAIYFLAAVLVLIAIFSNMVIANKLDKIYHTIPSVPSLWDVEQDLSNINETLKTLKPFKKK